MARITTYSFDGSESLRLNAIERSRTCILIVDQDPHDKENLRLMFTQLGFPNITTAADHSTGLEKLQERPITHIFFDARATNLTPHNFWVRALHFDHKLIGVPTSYNPTVDDVFSLLMVGANGYLVKPFTPDTLDESIGIATKGEPLADVILNARNRNHALASFALSALDHYAGTARDAKRYETARRELPRSKIRFKHAARLARTFCQEGEEQLCLAIIEQSIKRGKGPASPLGRFRQQLQRRKKEFFARLGRHY